MSTDLYPWLLAIRRTPRWEGTSDWQQAFRDAGRRLFFEIDPTMFDADGQLYAGGRPIGRYRFVETDEIRATCAERAWLQLEAPCEWIGGVEGFLTWEWWTAPADRRFDLERFLGASKGYVVRLRDDLAFDVIACNSYQLADAHAKHGFGDGDDLPELGPAYEAYVWDTIARALAKVGLRARKINYGTSHNRIRFDTLIPARGESLAEAWARFERHRESPLRLWAYTHDRSTLDMLVED